MGLKGMKNDRAAGPSGLTSDMLKYAGRTGVLEVGTTEGVSENSEKWDSAKGMVW